MKNLKLNRLKRAKKTRMKISELGVIRLSVYRTNQHIYAQLIDDANNRTLTSASTVEPDIKSEIKFGNNVSAAVIVGKRIAEKARNIGVDQIAFDRSGYRYHGRIKALAEAARESGLKF